MAITRIHHVGLVVSDADQALGFYCETLGLTVTRDAMIPEQGVRGVLLGLENAEIELIQPIEAETGVARFLARHGEGLHHLCLESTDVVSDLQAAAAAGLRMIDETPRPGLAGQVGFVHPESTHHVLLELAQPPAGTAPANGARPDYAPRTLEQVIVAVDELEAAAATFAERFGFERVDGKADADAADSVMLALGSGRLWLVPAAAGDAGTPVQRQLRTAGMFEIDMRVDDLTAAHGRLTAAAVRCTEPLGAAGSYLDPESTHGARIQLMERAD